MTNVHRHSRYGLRGARVGEASNPGPRLLRRHPGARGAARTLVDSDEEPLLHASRTISVSHSVLSTVPASHDALCETGRRFPPVVATFLTEADSDDQNCGPEVVPVDTDDEVDRMVDALHHDLEDHAFGPIADLNSSAPRKRSPVGREPRVSPAVEVSSDDEHMIRPINGRHVVPRLEHESVDGSAQFASALDAEICTICTIVPAFSRVLGAVGHVTIQNRFEALREDVDVPCMDEPHCAATWFDMSTDSDQCVECSAGVMRSAVLGHCEAAPASSNAVFRGRVAEVCGDRARSATHIRERVPDRISQATTLALVEEPNSGSDASALGSPRSMGGIRAVNRGTPEDSGLDGVVSSETESLFGASEASGEEIVDSLPEVEVFMPNLRAAGFRAAFAALDEVDLPLMFERRAVVMRSIAFFLRGPYRNAMLLALEEICASEALRRARGWKLFLLLPRMLLHRPPRVEPCPSTNWKLGLTDSHAGNGQNSCGKASKVLRPLHTFELDGAGEDLLMTWLHVQSVLKRWS